MERRATAALEDDIRGAFLRCIRWKIGMQSMLVIS